MASLSKQPGFLTKMVGLIRASAKPDAPEDGGSVQARETSDREQEKKTLKEFIENRRKDDQVRRREFNYLRKVRAAGMAALTGTPNRPSVFQNSSSFNPDAGERRKTVRKIDDIEAQLANQWAASKIASKATSQPIRQTKTRTMPLQPLVADAPPAAHEPVVVGHESEMDLDFTGLLAEEHSATVLSPLLAQNTATSKEERGRSDKEAANRAEDAWPSGFSPSRHMSVDLGENAENPALQDAAIRFAQGDDAGAEAALLAVLQSPDAGDDAAEACSAALLDLYRATGQKSDFDMVAIEYAQLFGRSAPEWFSVEDVASTLNASGKSPAVQALASGPSPAWTCPATLALKDVTGLLEAGNQRPSPILVWDALQVLAPDCIAPLREVFRGWAAKPIELHFSGEDALLNALIQATALQDRSVDPAWWGLRLEVLQVLNRSAEFEDAALDFCVIYEVSPPSWSEPRCRLVHAQPGAQGIGASSSLPKVASAFTPLEQHSQEVLELNGVLRGDVSAALGRLVARTPLDEPFIFSCTRLVRMDFDAAGSILSWVSGAEAQRRSVQFIHVPRLLAAYFDVMGISSHARVLAGKR
jgi:hypothetical protein